MSSSKRSNTRTLLLVLAVLISDGLCLSAWVVQSFPMPRRANHRLSTALLREINELELPTGDKPTKQTSKQATLLSAPMNETPASRPVGPSRVPAGAAAPGTPPFLKVESLIEDLIKQSGHSAPRFHGETRGLGGRRAHEPLGHQHHQHHHQQSRSLVDGADQMKPETRSGLVGGYGPAAAAAAAATTTTTSSSGGTGPGPTNVANDCDWRTSIAIGTSGYRFPCVGGRVATSSSTSSKLNEASRQVSDEYLRISANFERMIDQLRGDAQLLLNSRGPSARAGAGAGASRRYVK